MRLGIACILRLLGGFGTCFGDRPLVMRFGAAPPCAIMARDVRRMRRGLVEIKNWSIALNCGDEDTLGLADTGDSGIWRWR